MNLPDDRRRIVGAFCSLLQCLNLLRRVDALRIDALEPEGPFDSDLPIPEGSVRKDLRLLPLFELEERVADALDVLGVKLAVLLAEILCARACTDSLR